MGGKFSIMDYLIWNEIPTIVGQLVGGLAFTGLTLYSTHIKTAPKRALSSCENLALPPLRWLRRPVGFRLRTMPSQLKISVGQYSDKGRKESTRISTAPDSRRAAAELERHRHRARGRHQQQRGEPDRERVAVRVFWKTTTARRRRGRSRSRPSGC